MSRSPSPASRLFLVWSRCALFAAVLLLGCVRGSAAEAPELTAPAGLAPGEKGTDLAEFWRMTGPQRNEPHPVRFELEVYFYDPTWRMIWGNAGGEGFYFTTGPEPLDLKEGDRFFVHGNWVPSARPSLSELKMVRLPPRSEKNPAGRHRHADRCRHT